MSTVLQEAKKDEEPKGEVKKETKSEGKLGERIVRKKPKLETAYYQCLKPVIGYTSHCLTKERQPCWTIGARITGGTVINDSRQYVYPKGYKKGKPVENKCRQQKSKPCCEPEEVCNIVDCSSGYFMI